MEITYQSLKDWEDNKLKWSKLKNSNNHENIIKQPCVSLWFSAKNHAYKGEEEDKTICDEDGATM